MSVNNVEIGSEFWDVPTRSDYQTSIFPDNTCWFLSGRIALNAIIKDIKNYISFKSVAMPSWCCESMIQPFIQNQIEVKFYSVCIIDGRLSQKFDEADGCDAILVVDYFGYTCNTSNIDFDGIVIHDVTHSIFSGPTRKFDYAFGSLRKWAGFFTGGFAISSKAHSELEVTPPTNEYIALRKSAMEKKSAYIGRKNISKSYLDDFAAAERMLDSISDNSSADIVDIKRAKALDIKHLREKRRQNAELLLNELSDFVIFPRIEENDCPLFVPLFIENGKRDDLHKHLINKQIYCPIHWPISKFHKLTSLTSPIYENEISLICDQRYTPSDMYRIVEEVKTFLSMR